LIAYIVEKDGSETSNEELRAYLNSRLPHYMTPNRWIRSGSIPLTPNGKVDRLALVRMKFDGEEREIGYEPPSTALQEELSRIWKEILGAERVGIRDNFFDLGGHSLLATQVVSKVRERLAVELSVRVLFERPTIAALSEFIGSINGSDSMDQPDRIAPAAREAYRVDPARDEPALPEILRNEILGTF
jgi:hypothetical protein